MALGSGRLDVGGLKLIIVSSNCRLLVLKTVMANEFSGEIFVPQILNWDLNYLGKRLPSDVAS